MYIMYCISNVAGDYIIHEDDSMQYTIDTPLRAILAGILILVSNILQLLFAQRVE